MSVLVVTSLGDIVIDLYTDRCPLTCKNFLKLCKIKYYHGCLFHTVQKDFTAQTGDPTGSGRGGDSIYRFLYGDQARFFSDEIHLDLNHLKKGTVAMASAGENLNASQFYITLRDGLDYLDGKHTVFGEVAEGLDTLERINEAFVDEKGRPYKNIRIKHAYILDDPFEDPSQLSGLIPDASPVGIPKEEVQDDVRLEDDWVPMDEQLNPEELKEVIRAKEAYSRAVVLETLEDIPHADIKPPDNVLFVCKLNPVTEDEDLHTIFSRFGTVTSAEIIRDYKTGDSLCYAFIEFEDEKACIEAYKKMDNALIDDRRIKVDFSQSVAKLWNNFRRKGSKDGRGCFKCGSLDHIAKDCSGVSTMSQQQKYVLKDNNAQRGGKNNASYDMVFDEEDGGSPKQESRHRERGREDDHNKKQKDHVKRDAPGDRHRSRRDREDNKREREVYFERREERECRRNEESNYHHKRRGEKESGIDRGDKERGLRKRSLEHNTGQYERDREDGYKRRNADGDDDRRVGRGRERDRNGSSHRSRKGEREHKRRSPDVYDNYDPDYDRRRHRERR